MKELLALYVLISAGYCCLITNCPRGGKRSHHSESPETTIEKFPLAGLYDQSRYPSLHVYNDQFIDSYARSADTTKSATEACWENKEFLNDNGNNQRKKMKLTELFKRRRCKSKFINDTSIPSPNILI
ncbi:uncharacterized protein LOC105699950 [Orussus abietinus]|uniref:uncharacterized protein LOC105699950 n=1 Tax=Orussus abietinus TaxID=222816 RepID=UPI00062638DB|nr:uncharacterized protein LOC105699950 [Orussus abietinus]